MTPFEQLVLRAHRMMRDGLTHSDAAIAWAIEQLDMARAAQVNPIRLRAQRGPFTLRELSLGAGEVVSL